MTRVLVIVVTHNGMHWLDRCLGSVYADADLYVWDNDSVDGSADYVQQKYPDAKLIRSAENLGFSIPNNKGMQYALDKGYDYVYLLNQDAWLEPGALEKLVAAADAHPEYGLLSPLQMTDGYEQLDKQFAKILRRYAPQNDSARVKRSSERPAEAVSDEGGLIGREPQGDNRGAEPTSTFDGRGRSEAEAIWGCVSPSEPVPVKFVMAAHWLVPTAVIRRIGLFNEELFPLWGQDDDWCHRLDFCGLKIGVVPEARAVHDRAYRKEEKETLVRRNYYTGSLVRLADPRKPVWASFLFVILFTFVKAVKYRSWLPFKYFRKVSNELPQVKRHRKTSRTRT